MESRTRPLLPVLGLRLVLILALGLGSIPWWSPPAAQAASIAVTTAADELNADGDCSLREAIVAANTDAAVDACGAGSGIDTIALPAGTYTLSIPGADEDAGATGDLDITRGLVITGAGAGTTIIDGGGRDRVLHVLGATTAVTLSDLTIRNGQWVDAGGGIHSQGALTLNGVTVSGNGVEESGGGIFSTGSLTLNNSTVSGNRTNYAGGGGIYSGGPLTINGSTVSGNTASSGGGVYHHSGTVTIASSVFSGNSSSVYGGGIFIGWESTWTVTGSSFVNNSAQWGGGIDNHGTLNVYTSVFDHNTGGDGAGGGGGGAILNGGTARVTDSTLSSNTGTYGGGIENFAYDLTVVNSTISGNNGFRGGGALMNGRAHVLYQDGPVGRLTLLSSTVSGNSVTEGDGGGVLNLLGSSVTVRNSQVVQNMDAGGEAPNCSGEIISGGYNLIANNTGCSFVPASGEQLGTGTNPINPLLGPLQDNGGPTWTHALLPGSPAIDAGNPAGCTDGGGAPLTADQRGFPRPLDGDGNGTPLCDIGAYEAEATEPAQTLYLAEGYTGAGFGTFILVQNPNASPARVTLTYMLEGGGVETRSLLVPANARQTVAVQDASQLGPDVAFSTRLDADRPIVAERAMYWPNGAGTVAGHVAAAIAQPASTWYLAEGYTGPGFGTFILVQNPNPSAADVTVTYMLEGGGTVERTLSVPAHARHTIAVQDPAQLGADTAFSTKLVSSVPVIVERAMYFPNEGHATGGLTAPAETWYLAEGYTGGGAGTFILLQNPRANPANVTVRYMLQGGGVETRTVVVPGNARYTIAAQDPGQLGPDKAFSTKITSDRPIVVERAMYWPGGEGALGGHATVGVLASNGTWYLAEGFTGAGFGTFILLQNPNAGAAEVTVSYMLEGGGVETRTLSVAGNSRSTVVAQDAGQLGADRAFAARLVSSRPIIVERSMYFANGGHNATGVTLP